MTFSLLFGSKRKGVNEEGVNRNQLQPGLCWGYRCWGIHWFRGRGSCRKRIKRCLGKEKTGIVFEDAKARFNPTQDIAGRYKFKTTSVDLRKDLKRK